MIGFSWSTSMWHRRNTKRFKHYLDLPIELRMMIVNELPVDDRCRFSRCSKLSRKEVEISKNYIRELKFNLVDGDMYLHVKFGKVTDNDYGFRFNYIDEIGRKSMKCVNLRGREIFWITLKNSENMVEFAIRHAKKIMRTYESQIKKLEIAINHPNMTSNSIEFGIENLKNLEELVLLNLPDFQQFLKKIRKNLMVLEIVAQLDDRVVVEDEQVRRVQRDLLVPKIAFTKQQLFKLSAKLIYSHIGSLGVDDVFDLIKLWQNGTIDEDFVAYSWCLGTSNFDVTKLFALFGEKYDGETTKSVNIKHDKDAEIDCKLFLYTRIGPWNQRVLIFVNMDRFREWWR